MHEIVMGHSADGGFSAQLLEQLYRFRHRVFKEKLGWEVSTRRGLECDWYDELNPVHIACRQRGVVVGSFRLLPTTGPYMLRDTFAQLLRGEEAPCASDVWEMSRFAVEPPHGTARVQAECSGATFEMMRACFRFAEDNGIREYVAATSVSIERMMRNLGIPMTRFGDGKAVRIGKVLSVACRIPINEQVERALFSTAAEADAEALHRSAA